MEKILEYKVDVLILGGGPAGTWAALKAAEQGSSVILADKGYCGTSGATAPSGTGVWIGDKDSYQQQVIENHRVKLGGFLAEEIWKQRVLEQAKRNMHFLGQSGFPNLLNENNELVSGGLPGPQYMKHMRKLIKKAGVTILDHAPALELLGDSGNVEGARGIFLQKEQTYWRVEASAVVIATGGCAFLSNALGCNVNTGDGYLLAVEAGADLSGMEFSSMYGISAEFSSVTKNAFFRYGRYYYEDGSIVQETEMLSEPFIAANVYQAQKMLAEKLQKGKIYCRLDHAPPEIWDDLRKIQPNFFLPFDKKGINPFLEKFPVIMRLEGTVRGTGGINIINEYCETKVKGLFAAGDAATRELLCGAFSGGGSHNAAWAMTSGYWAGIGASKYASEIKIKIPKHNLNGLSAIPFVESNDENTVPLEGFIQGVQNEVFPLEGNFFRTGDGLKSSLNKLEELWQKLKQRGLIRGKQDSYEREVAAMIATARWMYKSALERKESRGLHIRRDFPETDPAQQYRLIISGIEGNEIRKVPVRNEVHY